MIAVRQWVMALEGTAVVTPRIPQPLIELILRAVASKFHLRLFVYEDMGCTEWDQQSLFVFGKNRQQECLHNPQIRVRCHKQNRFTGCYETPVPIEKKSVLFSSHYFRVA